ncbi:hypothetical protein OE749_12935 [Aestuariibacter sp. AA17]|uniref:Uncharacterized protein n=1 Tax=Fluctibacter corallii TaxID=2984329 RepID=A0ABT3AAE5_9ALTE|nr:hypothetical protein [Aestuariibacter sp. AA17]MCV2885598.1 hypothetical protein [Aestuariibacter sp. AA17]
MLKAYAVALIIATSTPTDNTVQADVIKENLTENSHKVELWRQSKKVDL